MVRELFFFFHLMVPVNFSKIFFKKIKFFLCFWIFFYTTVKNNFLKILIYFQIKIYILKKTTATLQKYLLVLFKELLRGTNQVNLEVFFINLGIWVNLCVPQLILQILK